MALVRERNPVRAAEDHTRGMHLPFDWDKALGPDKAVGPGIRILVACVEMRTSVTKDVRNNDTKQKDEVFVVVVVINKRTTVSEQQRRLVDAVT